MIQWLYRVAWRAGIAMSAAAAVSAISYFGFGISGTPGKPTVTEYAFGAAVIALIVLSYCVVNASTMEDEEQRELARAKLADDPAGL